MIRSFVVNEDAPRITLKQDRIDGRAEINAGGSMIDKIAYLVKVL